jgi:colanic acid biosynthesis glycosyl transferase WcaI
MKRIWVLTELYYPEHTSTAYFLTEIAQSLAKKYDVSVLTGNAMYEQQGKTLRDREVVEQVDILRCQGTSFNKNYLLGRLLNGCSRSLSIFWQSLWHCSSSDVILVVTNPPLLPVMALLLKWLKGCRFVLLVHDVYPEVLVASGLTQRHSLLYRTIYAVNSIVCRNSSHIITLGRDMSQLIQAKLPKHHHHPITCIPNWAEVESIHPIAKTSSALLQQLNLTDKFVVLYAGNMGRTHDLEILAEAAQTLAIESSQIHFLFIGAGAKKQWLEQYCQDHQLTNITVLPYLPHAEKNTAINSCDLSVISFLPGMAGVSVPSRMYNQMAAGKPLLAIADDWSELAQVIQEENIGWVTSSGNSEALVEILRQADRHREIGQVMGAKAAAITNQKYTLKQASQAYEAVFDQLFNPAKSAQAAINRL